PHFLSLVKKRKLRKKFLKKSASVCSF
ncbi:UvrABC system protein A, partial [Haemophilus influenzae]